MKYRLTAMLLAGGGRMNGSFLQANLIDELSLVLTPVPENDQSKVGLFEREETLPKGLSAAFTLESVREIEDGGVWLRFLPKRKETEVL